MSNPTPPDEISTAACCDDVYNHPLVIELLEGTFHPGGLALTAFVADQLNLHSESILLDLASGEGTTGNFLAKTKGCIVVGVDSGLHQVSKAVRTSKATGNQNPAQYLLTLAGVLPFADGSFSAAISECSICIFPDKQVVASELTRLLTPAGRLGVSDVLMREAEELDPELRSLIGHVACVAGALSEEDYIMLFEEVGFRLLGRVNHNQLLAEMVHRTRANAKLLHGLA